MKTALVFSNLKENLLYFENIIPCALVHDFVDDPVFAKEINTDLEMKKGDNSILIKILDFLPVEMNNDDLKFLPYVYISITNYIILESKLKYRVRFFDPDSKKFEDSKNFLEQTERISRQLFGVELNEFNSTSSKLSALSKAFLQRIPTKDYHTVLSDRTQVLGGEDAVDVSLSGLKMIDASDATLEQILEFRERQESVMALRRLRLFLNQDFRGMSEKEVTEKLELSIYDYENEARRWGFKTRDAALGAIVNSKTLPTSGAGTLIALLSGATGMAAVTAITGAGVELIRYSLKVREMRSQASDILSTNPVSYIVEARKALGKTKNS
ncbi:MAG: hypothetical protein AAGC81_08990 [Pseudomonadota bacterium]